MYIVYKTINLINNKFYIGVHRTGSSRKYYLGSGIRLKKAIEKYGSHNFKRVTLFENLTKEEAFKIEKELLTPDLLKSNHCYNLAVGGLGGDLGENSNKKKRGDLNWCRRVAKELLPCYGRTGKKHPNYGKKAKDFMTEAGLILLSEKTRLRQLGAKNTAARKVVDLITGIEYNTLRECSINTGINYSTVCAVAQGRKKCSKLHSKRFKYVDQRE